jgi:hypothetical protein
MRREQNRVIAGQRSNEFTEISNLSRVEACCCLVQHQQWRFANQGLRQAHALAIPAGQFVYVALFDLLQIGPFHGFDAFVSSFSGWDAF